VEILQFLIFLKDGSRHHLGFLKSWNLFPNGVQRFEVHQHAKYHQNLLIGCEDIRIFRFLDLFRTYLDHPQWVIGGLYHCAIFGYNQCSSFYNMNISVFGTFGVLGQFDSLNGLQYQPKPKKSASFEPSSVKMWWTVWPVGEFIEKGGINQKLVIFHRFAQKPSPHGRITTKFAQL